MSATEPARTCLTIDAMRLRSCAVAISLVAASCVAPPPPTAPASFPPTTVVVPTVVLNGRVEVRIQTVYTLGLAATIPISVTATRGRIIGPRRARIVASAINERFAAAEAIVRILAQTSVTVEAGHSASTAVSWDGRDERGALVPADDYVVVLDFDLDDTGAVTTTTATATLQWRSP